MIATLTNNQFTRRFQDILSNKKAVRFSLTSAAGAFLGSVLGYQIGDGAASGFLFGMLQVSAWDACIGTFGVAAVDSLKGLFPGGQCSLLPKSTTQLKLVRY